MNKLRLQEYGKEWAHMYVGHKIKKKKSIGFFYLKNIRRYAIKGFRAAEFELAFLDR
jgi:hypothetical protein